MERKNSKIQKLVLKKFGTELFERSLAKTVLESLGDFSVEDTEIFIVDFVGVSLISSGFAFDLFQGLRKKFGARFLGVIRVRFENDVEAALMRSVVKGALLNNQE